MAGDPSVEGVKPSYRCLVCGAFTAELEPHHAYHGFPNVGYAQFLKALGNVQKDMVFKKNPGMRRNELLVFYRLTKVVYTGGGLAGTDPEKERWQELYAKMSDAQYTTWKAWVQNGMPE